MCPDRHARPARPAPHVQTAARGPLGSGPRRLGRRGPTARHTSLVRRADLRPTPPNGPVHDAVRAPGQAGRLGLQVHQPAAAATRRPYFIELSLRGLAQGRVHGPPKGLDDGVRIHRRAVGQTRDTGATEPEIAPLTAHMDRSRSAAATGAKGKRSAKAPDRTFSPRRGGGRCFGHFLSAHPRSTLGNVVRKRRHDPRGWLKLLKEKTFKCHRKKSKHVTKIYMISLEALNQCVTPSVVTNCISKRKLLFYFLRDRLAV